jgi:hypothetical protein
VALGRATASLNLTTMTADIKAAATLATFPDGTKVLMGEIVIDCESCGGGTVRLPGHHMRVVRNLLMQWCDEYPELTGSDEHIREVGRTRIEGTPPADPEMN